VCRLRNNTILNNKLENDFITKSANNIIRIVKYNINKNNYILATNMININREKIEELYFKRWSIEEYFKYIKRNFNFSNLNETKLESIKKTICAQLIITSIAFAVTFLYNKYNKIKSIYVINKSVLINGLFDSLLIKIFLLKINKNTFSVILDVIIKITHTNKGKTIPIICNRPGFKWYLKKYKNSVKLTIQ
jgi:hypothetical protein